MKNPFEILDLRLNNIESILLDIKHKPKKENESNDDNPLGIKDVAKLTGYTLPTLYGYCQRNEIPYHKKHNRLFFFKPEIIDWIKTGKQKTLKEIQEDTEAYLSKK